ncbi:MAG: hypothetical protein HY562_11600 [Ignavibacteriales bacterium]|nr:hypothetical protein [Ignavibacteriales bacterium]
MTPRTNALFLKEYIRDPLAIGSVVPDSRTCVKALLKHVPFDSSRIILEFGSASGAVTEEIMKRKRENTMLVCFEKNPHFYESLKRRVRGTNVILSGGDVQRSNRFLYFQGIAKGTVDCIISTLPCSNLDYETILEQSVISWLKPDGLFVQYMHVLSYLKGFSLESVLSKHFGSIQSDFVFSNIPPAIVYHCRVNGKADS